MQVHSPLNPVVRPTVESHRVAQNQDTSYTSYFFSFFYSNPEYSKEQILEFITNNTIKDILDKKGNIVIDEAGNTVLHLCAEQGFTNLVLYLIQNLKVNMNVQRNDGSSPLHLAVKHGHKETALQIILAGANVELTQKKGNTTALHLACINRDIEIIRSLLKVKINLNSKAKYLDLNLKNVINNKYEWSVLHVAARLGKADIVKLLLEHKVDINLLDNENNTPLHLASLFGYKDVVQFLINAGAQLDVKNNFGNTALHLAAQKGHEFLVHLFYAAGADFSVKNKNELTSAHLAEQNYHTAVQHVINNPLVYGELDAISTRFMFACQYGLTEIVRAQLVKKLNVFDGSLKNNSKCTVLHIASYEGHEDIVKLLLGEYGNLKNNYENYWLNLQNSDHDTALNLAIKNGHSGIAKLLMAANANVNLQDKFKNTPLHYAALYNDESTVKLLLRSGARTEIYNHEEDSPLAIAINNEHMEIIKILIEHGAEVNGFNKLLNTPLHIACKIDSIEIAKYLIIQGANLNVLNFAGNTPLHIAVLKEQISIVKLLVAAGANVFKMNEDGETPIQLAEDNGFELIQTYFNHILYLMKDSWSCVQLLCDYEDFDFIQSIIAKPNFIKHLNSKNSCGETSFSIACRNGKLELVKLLLSAGVDINLENNENNTPIMSAFMANEFEIVEFLISSGANLNVENKKGLTLLYLAAQEGKEEIVKLLIASGAILEYQSSISAIRFTPLDLAYKNSQKKIIDLLEKAIKRQTHYKWTPLHYAALKGYNEILKLLIGSGANLEAKTIESDTPIKKALGSQRLKPIEILKDAELKVKLEHYSPLHLAAYYGCLEVVKNHLANGVNINGVNSHGFSALHLACRAGHQDVAKYLIENGANLEIVNNEGLTALKLAQHHHRHKIISYFPNASSIIPSSETISDSLNSKNKSQSKLTVGTKLEKITDLEGKYKNYNWSRENHKPKVEKNIPETVDELRLAEGEFTPSPVLKMRCFKIPSKDEKDLKDLFKKFVEIKNDDKDNKVFFNFTVDKDNKVNQDHFIAECQNFKYIVKSILKNGTIHYTLTNKQPLAFNKTYSRFLDPIRGHFYFEAVYCPEGHLNEKSILKANIKNNIKVCPVGNHPLPDTHNLNNFNYFYEAEPEYSLSLFPETIQKGVEAEHYHKNLKKVIEYFVSNGGSIVNKITHAGHDIEESYKMPYTAKFIEKSAPFASTIFHTAEGFVHLAEAHEEFSKGNYGQALSDGFQGAMTFAGPAVYVANSLLPSSKEIITFPIAVIGSEIIKHSVSAVENTSECKKNIIVDNLKIKLALFILRISRDKLTSKNHVDAAHRNACHLYNASTGLA